MPERRALVKLGQGLALALLIAALLWILLPAAYELKNDARSAAAAGMALNAVEQIRDGNAEIVAGLVVELADPDLDADKRRLKEAQLKAAEERLAWAEDYLRLGHDPETGRREALGR